MAIPIGLLVAGQVLGTVFNQMAAKRRFNRTQQFRRAEQMRQLRRQDEARARAATEVERFEPEAHQETLNERTQELVDVLTEPEIDTSVLAPRLDYTAPTTSQPTLIRETEERARAREQANRTGEALARSTALGDVFAQHGINLGRGRQDLATIGVAANDSARTLRGFELPAALQEGQGLDFLGNVTRGAANLGTAYTLGAGAGAGPAPAVDISPSTFKWFPTAGGRVRKFF